MSYQIKSTPFFRRMVSASKKNGQLQRLKEEYERIKEFNDRTIEMKMRQVRLKRLFREIEEIKESSSQWKRRRIATERSKTNEEKRAQTLVKSKELGKQYSKMNALVERCASRMEAASSGAAVGGMFSRMELERKQRSDKRINYGNNRSRMNIQKLTTSPRKPVGKPELATERELKELKEKRNNRLSFGNSCSSRNLLKKVKKNNLQKSSNGTSISSLNDSEITKVYDQDSQYKFAHDAEAVDLPVMMFVPRQKDFEDMCRRKSQSNSSKTLVKTEEDPQIRAKQHWRKLALIVRQRNVHPLVDNQEDSSEEYTLREISNTTDLTLRQLKNKTSPSNSENDLLPGEVLLSVESLHPLEMQSLPALKTTAAEKPRADKGGSPIDPLRKVQQYVKMFEPIVRDVARKEVLEFGIEKLRSIFEHQSVEQ
ncbi:uncharacterized protein LOC129239335 [Anastrepha obliqua]|uniref:uncharacterized protein LOC129239335 n=1 Tax=Anastrepha obliqua TaxID=95512 RepID=UPI002409A8FF|nr:uncharacterized protein LOC129239335 [Anastrepha obliqua]